MSIHSNINGTTGLTGPGNKLFYRESASASYTQIKHCYYRESPQASWTEIYYYDATPATITITSAGGNVLSNSYTLTAVVSDTESGIASITINGQNYPVTSGATTVDVSRGYTLGQGSTTFTITAVDVAGNTSSASVTVNYVNQKDDPNNNWSQTYTAEGNKQRYVLVNGSWYEFWAYGHNTSESFAPSSASINSTIPLPKGLSRMYGRIGKSTECGHNRSISYRCSITLRDNSTGQVLASVSFDGEESSDYDNQHTTTGTAEAWFDWYLSAEQSVHNLVVIISGTAGSDQHGSSTARVGIPPDTFVTFSWF